MASERRPRPWEYATYARYFAAIMSWIDWAYPGEDNRILRAQIWRVIESEEHTLVPVKRTKKAAAETWEDRELREGMLAMWDRLPATDGESPGERTQRRRMLDLSLRGRERLTPGEAVELDTLRAASPRDPKLDRAIDKRLRKHPEESRADAALAVILKRAAKRQAREDAADEAEEAEELAAEEERRAARAASAKHTPKTATTRATRPAPGSAEPPATGIPDQPPKRRLRAGFAEQLLPDGRGGFYSPITDGDEL